MAVSFIGGGNQEYLEKCIIFERNYVVILRFCISKMSCLFTYEKKINEPFPIPTDIKFIYKTKIYKLYTPVWTVSQNTKFMLY
jgi:hypothetical protein